MFKTIRAKLLSSFVLILLLMSGLGAAAYHFSQANGTLTEEAINKEFNGSVVIATLAVEAQKIRRYEKEYFIYVGDAQKAKKYQDEWTGTYKTIQSQLGAIIADHAGIWTSTEKAEFRQWEAALVAYGQGFDKVVSDVKSGALPNTLTANAAISDAKDKFRVLLDGTVKVGEQKLRNAKTAASQITEGNRVLVRVLVGAVSGSVLLCLVLAVLVPASITRPIRTLSEAAAAMSMGNLQQAVPSTVGVQDFVGLAETLERMRISLKLMMERITPPDQNASPAASPAASTGRTRGATGR